MTEDGSVGRIGSRGLPAPLLHSGSSADGIKERRGRPRRAKAAPRWRWDQERKEKGAKGKGEG